MPALAKRLSVVVPLVLLAACGGGGGEAGTLQASTAESCMLCHNASLANDYAGPGIENPHPFAPAANLRCTTCHGGNGNGTDKVTSHVPPPPEIGDDAHLIANRTAYFNRLTLTGIDKFPDYTVSGTTYTALDYLQFVNPGDLRVVTQGRACGQCHQGHAQCSEKSLLASEAGILAGAMYAVGIDNEVPESVGLWEDTAADQGFRAVTDPGFNPAAASVGAVGRLLEFPVFSVFGQFGGDNMHNNDAYDADLLPLDLNPDNSVIQGSKLANLYHEQVAFTCGDCHLGSAGQNNRYGDFRSAGCTACHLPYSLDGRSRSGDPNVDTLEPANPDQIQAPERAHVRRHLILSTAKTLPSGEHVQGIDDHTCAGCHQGSNRTVMQYWGIRLDQNRDVQRGQQYPTNPVTYTDTRDDTRLFDPVVGNNTFNGRNDRQYLLFEDYDGDGRDDTPPDVHYEAGLGCIDCHGSFDMHGGDVANPGSSEVLSRMEQAVAIRCESCHGTVDAYAATVAGTAYDGSAADLAVDTKGHPLNHVIREGPGEYYLYSRLDGQRHYIKQTKDTVVDNGVTHPFTGQPVYSELASYAMGRDDGSAGTGIGPQQLNSAHAGFSHADNVSCVACHASWTNNCIGCHLGGEYNTNNNNFSNITGQRIVFRQEIADFVYQSPVFFQLGVGADNKIVPISPDTLTFFQYKDKEPKRSQVFAFSDRNGLGNNPAVSPHPALSHNAMMPHSIRGKVTSENEGPRYCVACHITEAGMAAYGAEYTTLRTAMQDPNFTGLDQAFFENVLKTHFGSNTGNRLNSPLWVHAAVGLGSGLFLFDQRGCPENPIDGDTQRKGCDGEAPAADFDTADAAFNLDRIVEEDGTPTSSSNHMLLDPGAGPPLRDGPGMTDPDMAGPLGQSLIRRLSDPDPAIGIHLDAWIDADGVPQGNLPAILHP
jgi:hypothetical protein